MAQRTGTASQDDASAGNGSTSVTVPADATAVVAFWSHFDGNGGSTLSGLTLNGVSFFPADSQLAEGATADESGVGVASLASPATGSQTLAWTWSAGAARAEGGEIVLVYVKDVDIADLVRAAATDAQISTDNCSVNVASEATDLLLAFAQDFNEGTPDDDPALDGTVFINDALLNLHSYDVSEVTPGAGSTTVNMTGEAFSAMAAVTLKAATGASPGGNVPGRMRGFKLGQMADAEDEGRFNELDVRNWWREAFA